MYRIFAYCGSRNPQSRTLQAIVLIQQWLSSLQDSIDTQISWTICTPKDLRILPSDGTAREFSTGVDRQELLGIDDSGRLKTMIEHCDYLILGSPTYGHNVSGDMKIVMDRLCYWSHLFYLSGKPGMPLVSASTNGYLKVGDMLERFMDSLGIVRDPTAYNTYGMPFENNEAQGAARHILAALTSHEASVPNGYQEELFRSYKRSYIRRDEQNAEYRYWKKHRMFDCDSLAEYFASLPQVEH